MISLVDSLLSPPHHSCHFLSQLETRVVVVISLVCVFVMTVSLNVAFMFLAVIMRAVNVKEREAMRHVHGDLPVCASSHSSCGLLSPPFTRPASSLFTASGKQRGSCRNVMSLDVYLQVISASPWFSFTFNRKSASPPVPSPPLVSFLAFPSLPFSVLLPEVRTCRRRMKIQ